MEIVALRRAVAGWMTIHASRAFDDLADLAEDRGRARGSVVDRLKVGGRAQRVRHGGASRRDSQREGEDGDSHAKPPLPNGNRVAITPVSARHALATAGAVGGTPGSPTPVGAASDLTMTTSTAGISAMRSDR